MLRALPETVWHMERPFANLHTTAKLLAARFTRQHVGCVLTGDGGDETFCGYPTFLIQQEWQRAGANGSLDDGTSRFRTRFGRGAYTIS